MKKGALKELAESEYQNLLEKKAVLNREYELKKMERVKKIMEASDDCEAPDDFLCALKTAMDMTERAMRLDKFS